MRHPLIMHKPLNCSGQTLVETALVLPLFGFFVFGVVWLICVGHNAITLEKMALDKARIIAADPSSTLIFTPSDYFEPFWENSTWPIAYPTPLQIPQWRPFIPSIIPLPGLATVQTAPGSLIRVQCETVQTGRGHWTSMFLPKRLWTAAESFVEPRLPADS